MRGSRRLIARLLPALMLSACASVPARTDAPDVDDGVPTEIEIGTGLAAFEPLTPEVGELELVHGPQGGYHVYLSMRVHGVAPATFGWRVTRLSDEHALAYFTLGVSPTTFMQMGDQLERVGDRAIFDTATPDAALGAVRVEASITDAAGTLATQTITAIVVDREP